MPRHQPERIELGIFRHRERRVRPRPGELFVQRIPIAVSDGVDDGGGYLSGQNRFCHATKLPRIASSVDRLWPPVEAALARRPHGRSAAQNNRGRSEEHTSELQSLMRISYAVFCLKKKQQVTRTRLSHQRHESKTNHMPRHVNLII